MSTDQYTGVGKLNESNLHNAIKYRYSNNVHQHEVKVGRYHIDVKLDNKLVEIQTGNLGSIRNKLRALLKKYHVMLVIPIYGIKYIRKIDSLGNEISKRRSPKKGKLEDGFYELLRIPGLLGHPNFEVEILLIEGEEIWVDDGKGSWRRKGWSKINKELISIQDSLALNDVKDYLGLLPSDLPDEFTTRDLVNHSNFNATIAQQLCYTYRMAGFIDQVGKKGRYKLYRIRQKEYSST
ncbi:MAG: hypothetical protein INQ03_04655 [Candidatus Heimdallarchaeota archaeon]|nr:hypothetical protein [Candidatus Heimdallarchaeota archaeon]